HAEQEEWPLAINQRAMWYLQRLEPESPAYVIAFAARIIGPLDVSRLKRAFQTLVERHPALRTGFRENENGPMQIPQAHPTVDFDAADTGDIGNDELSARLSAEAQQPFDLARDPLFRVRLLHDERGCNTILVKSHHIVSDHRSLQILMEELSKFYVGEQRHAPADLKELLADYGDFVRWQSEMLSGPAGEHHWAYWRERLSGDLAALDLPADRTSPATRSSRGQRLDLSLNPVLARSLRELARAESVTLYMLLLAAFQALLHRYTGQDDILVGAPAMARGRAEFDRLIGYFVNMVVLRGFLSCDPPFRDLLRQTPRTDLS